MSIRILHGTPARERLLDPDFRRAWERLHERCSWATSFQHIDFVQVWSDVYQDEYDLLLLDATDDGIGLLPLATDRRTNEIVVAGTHHAEYQAWLAQPETSDDFFACAMDEVRSLGARSLRFRFLPAGMPTSMSTVATSSMKCVVRREPRPLMTLDSPDRFRASLRKKSNKSRLSRLRREGELSFRRLGSEDELAAVMDDVIDDYDFRQGAANGVMPFRSDPKKRRFHLELARRTDLLEAAGLWAGDRLVAAHVSVRHRREVSVGVFAHSPLHAAHSPGKFLLLMEGERLAGGADDDVPELAFDLDHLDLTPGGAWKDRFADDHDEVVELTVYLRGSGAVRTKIGDGVRWGVKRLLRAVGIEPSSLRRSSKASSNDDDFDCSTSPELRHDVLLFRDPGASKETRHRDVGLSPWPLRSLLDDVRFADRRHGTLTTALRRLEAGDEFVVAAPSNGDEFGSVAAQSAPFLWVTGRKRRVSQDVLQRRAPDIDVPDHAVVIYDVDFAADTATPRHRADFLASVAASLVAEDERRVVIVVTSVPDDLRPALTEVGFSPWNSTVETSS